MLNQEQLAQMSDQQLTEIIRRCENEMSMRRSSAAGPMGQRPQPGGMPMPGGMQGPGGLPPMAPGIQQDDGIEIRRRNYIGQGRGGMGLRDL